MSGIPREDCYEWMFARDTHDDYLDVLRELREGVETLPETRATFRFRDVTDAHPPSHPREMLWLLGSWEMPPRFPSSRATSWINPNYVHRHVYTNISASCRCNALIVRGRGGVETADGEGHRAGCEPEWREDARDRLDEACEQWIRNGSRLMLRAKGLAPRMGVTERSVYRLCKKYDIDQQACWRWGRERAIRTWRTLYHEHDRDPDEIARAFDYSRQAVSSYIHGHGRNISL